MQADDFRAVRAATVALAAGLTAEDCQIQSMPDASPVKWHLAHTSWFFETFVLHESYRPEFAVLFNSYYNSVGPMALRAQRGLISRPSLDEVFAYRAWIDERVSKLLEAGASAETRALVELGINHEQQHQELILTDVLHAFSVNPGMPAFESRRKGAAPTFSESAATFSESAATLSGAAPTSTAIHQGGVVEIGAGDSGFAFDNERPRHSVLLRPFWIADRPVTCGEYLAFIRAGGYSDPQWWLSDGWATVCAEGWRAPLYWSVDLEHAFTLAGVQRLDLDAPVCHISHYEADAYARWAGARLPTEFEWEAAAPRSAGSVWEWTASAYLPYPGFRPGAGAIGEYNGKFMSGQMVLRGGSFATPPGHARASYRNFFPPAARWQFSGLRLARDA